MEASREGSRVLEGFIGPEQRLKWWLQKKGGKTNTCRLL